MLGLGKFLIYCLSSLLTCLVRNGTACDVCVAAKIKCAASPEDAKSKKSQRKKTEEEHVDDGEEPKWVDEIFELVEGLGLMLLDMDREERKWRKTIEKRLDEMQTTLDEIKELETEEESEKESETKKDKGKGKEKEKGPGDNEDVDMGS